MSHFVVWALLDKKAFGMASDEELAAECQRLLDPFSEHIEVPEYDKRCYCVGNEAEAIAAKQMQAEMGTWDQARDQFQATYKNPHNWNTPEYDERESEIHELWINTFYNPRNKREQEILQETPGRDAPKPDCSSCGGTGTYRSTYNPLSKWDWWVIGGRWTGMLAEGYEAYKDPDNFKECWLCLGTGLRNDALGIQARLDDPAYTCNGCQGTGRMLKSASEFKPVGNVAPLDTLDLDKVGLPFAILTHSGEWYEKGKMGWWAAVSNENHNWGDDCKELLQQHMDSLVVVCDLHI